jgi:hypothetical protein
MQTAAIAVTIFVAIASAAQASESGRAVCVSKAEQRFSPRAVAQACFPDEEPKLSRATLASANCMPGKVAASLLD